MCSWWGGRQGHRYGSQTYGFTITWGPEYNAEVGLGALWDRSSSECGSLHDEAHLPPGPGPLVAFCGHIHGSPVCDRGLWWCQSLGGPGR